MDLDDLDEPSQVPSRTSRFAPKSSKFKPKPKSEAAPQSEEPQQPPTKLELQEPVSKPEPEKVDVQIAKKEEDEEVEVKPKFEASVSNGVDKMEVEDEAKTEDETETIVDDPMDEDVDEDMVIREIDVLFTPSADINMQLYVLQYPLRPRWRPYEFEGRCEEVRVNPSSREVEVDLKIDIESNNYDNKVDGTLQMEKQTLTTTWKPPPATTYAIGLLIDNKLHLSPLHAIVQLRPSFEHLNSGSSKRKTNARAESDIKSDEVMNEPSSVTSTKQSWVPLKYYSRESDLSARYLQSMVAQKSSPIPFTMNPNDYLNSLCGTCSSTNEPKGPSRRHLLSLSLKDRIMKLLREGPPVQRFSALKHYSLDSEAEEFMETLQQYGQLVQGLWVPKSSFILPEDGSERCARDFVLSMFSKNPLVRSSQINAPKSLRDKVKNYLALFAVERSVFKDWKFKEKTDHSFINKYPDIVQKHEKRWEEVGEKIAAFGGNIKSGPRANAAAGKPDMVPKLEKQVNSDKVATKNSYAFASQKSTMSDETREALPKALQKIFQNHKVCSFQLICQSLCDFAVSQSTLPKADARMAVAAARGVDAPEELKRIISQIATEIHGLYVLISSSEHPEYDPLRKVVIQLLRGRGPKAVLKKADVLEASKHELGRAINSNEYVKVMNELCVSQGSSWSLKSGDGNSR